MKQVLIGSILLFSICAQAEKILCQGQVDFYGETQKFEVLIEGHGIGQSYHPSTVTKVEVKGASLSRANVFTDAVDYWDGHSSGMITARGFSMTYDNLHGCIKNVVITTDFRADMKDTDFPVGHITRSEVIPLCDNGNQFCSVQQPPSR